MKRFWDILITIVMWIIFLPFLLCIFVFLYVFDCAYTISEEMDLKQKKN